MNAMVFIAFLVIASSAYGADNSEFYFQLGGSSIHQEERKDGKPWNQNNEGFGVQYSFPGHILGIDVGYYVGAERIRNSEFGQTTHLGGGIRKAILQGSFGDVSLGVLTGVMNYPSEYSNKDHADDFFLVALPTLSICSMKKICLDGVYIPKVQKNEGSAAILLTTRFGL